MVLSFFVWERSMYKEISLKMANGTNRTIGFLAVGSTPYRYKQLFRQDLLKDITKMINKDRTVSDDADFSVIDKLAFTMNCQAEKKDMNLQNYETFLAWVDGFETSELMDHASEIIGVYLGNKESTSDPKKEVEP